MHVRYRSNGCSERGHASPAGRAMGRARNPWKTDDAERGIADDRATPDHCPLCLMGATIIRCRGTAPARVQCWIDRAYRCRRLNRTVITCSSELAHRAGMISVMAAPRYETVAREHHESSHLIFARPGRSNFLRPRLSAAGADRP